MLEIIELSPARELDELEVQKISAITKEFLSVEAEGNRYHANRAKLFRRMFRFMRDTTRSAIEAYGQKHGYTDLGRTLDFGLVAQVLTGINISEVEGDERQERHNQVAPVAKMLAALEARNADHEHCSDEEFVRWYNEQGRVTGIWASFSEAQKVTKSIARQSSGNASGELGNEANVQTILNDLIANPAVREVQALPNLVPGALSLYVAQGAGDKARVLRLNASPALIASLAGNAPDPMENAPADLRFWSELLSVGEGIIPDSESDQPSIAVASDDEVNETTPKLPSNAMFLVRDGMFSVAAARDRDTMVVEVEPKVQINLPLTRDGFLNNRSRRLMSKRLTAPKTCAGYVGKDGSATSVTSEGDKAKVAFKHTQKALNGNLIVTPRTEMGSVWTYRVSGFKPLAQGVLSAEQVANFRTGFMVIVAKSKKELAITVSVSCEGLSFANGKAAATTLTAIASGEASVRVHAADFKLAMSKLLDLALIGGLAWKLDPHGLLMVEGSTEHATYRVFLQTLRSDVEAREHKLLELVNSTAAEPLAAAA